MRFLDIATILNIIYWLNILVAIYIMIKVVMNNRNPIKTIAWLLVLLFIPLIGLIFYFFFGRDTRRLRYINKRSLSQIQQRSNLAYPAQAAPVSSCEYKKMIDYFETVAESRPMGCNDVEVITKGPEFIDKLLCEIEAAQKHIHLLFYIFEDDEAGNRLRDALIAKASAGVEVRLIYDSVGCWKVSPHFFEEIRKAGGYVAPFLKVYFPILTNKINYRNHRKIVVIDGKVGFIGGYNIADRYVTGGEWGHWRDTMLLLRGGAVYGLQVAFLSDWFFADRSLVSGASYFPPIEEQGEATVQIVTSNPIGQWRTILNGMLMSLTNATEYIYMQSPYLMPNESVITAMQRAALSGVDVRLMLPEKADGKIADYASKSYYDELLDAGVKIYLYKKGFLHSKSLVSDDKLSVVGSANIDFRSFEYNFEVNAYVYDKSLACRLKQLFLDDIKDCRLLTVKESHSRSFGRRLMESGARLFSPLL